MELYDKVVRIIDYNIIYCLIPMIIILFLIEKVFKNKYPTQRTLSVIKWIILLYAIMNSIHFISGIVFYNNEYAFTNRVKGPYKLFYWIMLFSATIFPLTLLIKRLAIKFWYILLVAFAMKIGAYFELYVITVTSIHRDYLPNKFPSPVLYWGYSMSTIIIQALILVIFIIGILKLTDKIQHKLVRGQND